MSHLVNAFVKPHAFSVVIRDVPDTYQVTKLGPIEADSLATSSSAGSPAPPRWACTWPSAITPNLSAALGLAVGSCLPSYRQPSSTCWKPWRPMAVLLLMPWIWRASSRHRCHP